MNTDKTFVRRVGRGFDFLGYQFDETGLIGLSRRSIGRFGENLARRISADHNSGQLAGYVRRWWSWATGGLRIKTPEKEAFLKKEKFLNFEKIPLTHGSGCVKRQTAHIHETRSKPPQGYDSGSPPLTFSLPPERRREANRTRLYEQDLHEAVGWEREQGACPNDVLHSNYPTGRVNGT